MVFYIAHLVNTFWAYQIYLSILHRLVASFMTLVTSREEIIKRRGGQKLSSVIVSTNEDVESEKGIQVKRKKEVRENKERSKERKKVR